ncbi:MAG: ATP-dependent DNA helicase RecG [Candidatus Saccharibacteria bacterium]
MHLGTQLARLTGVGEVLRAELKKLGLETVGDLLNYFPRRYEDYSQVKPIAQLRPGPVSLKAKVDHISSRPAQRRRRMMITEVIVTDETGSLKLTWFNSPFVAQQLTQGEEYFFVGELKYSAGHFGIIQPSYEKPEATDKAGRIVAIYPESAKVHSKLLRGLISQCLGVATELVDELPEPVRLREQLMPRSEAVRALHQPTDTTSLERARERMAFTELFLHMLASRVLREQWMTEPGLPIVFDESLAKDFVAKLAFTLTDSQRAAAWQIFADMRRNHPMSRLLEGDVGSGKTVVAAFAALMSIRAGHQVAVMVPTEVLAQQHLQSFRDLLAAWQVRVELLTSRLPVARKRSVREDVSAGKVDLVIGTQALLTKGTEFASLGLVVVDEQHRFGVQQRLALKDKAGRLPHVLTMTATPIPRSLALVVYGDLDISILRELPPGRKPIKTTVVAENDRAKVYKHIDQLITTGQQAYIVCPMIDENDISGSKAVKAEYERLSRTIFAHRRIGLMHGKLSSDEKAEVMQAFVNGELDILISTTVIEVGVHADNATVMIVESAERFGLASLHQLRGRVGRSAHQAYCYLFMSPDAKDAPARVQAMERTTDGFRLAQLDLETRGPGQRFGLRQSGELDLRFARITDAPALERAQQAVAAFQTSESIVKYPQTLEVVNRLKTVTSLD